MDLSAFEVQFEARMARVCDAHPDPAHDILHVRRVVANAKRLAVSEGARLEVVVPAAYLHDVVMISKTDARRRQASQLSAIEAGGFLREIGYPEALIPDVEHAIEAHSFSAAIAARTLEAKVVQDADRLDALGAIGISRCLVLSGMTLRPIYFSEDPFGIDRVHDDSSNALDHFYVKLLRLPEMMQTSSGRSEADRRLQIMRAFLLALQSEIRDS
jgi:uncharacterized protein